MTRFETVHTKDFEGFTIELAMCPEEAQPDWDFGTEEDKAETLRKIENGSLLWFVARVTASRKGIRLGTDYLGGCCYPSIEHFLTDDYFAEMIDTAVSEAKKTLAELVKEV